MGCTYWNVVATNADAKTDKDLVEAQEKETRDNKDEQSIVGNFLNLVGTVA